MMQLRGGQASDVGKIRSVNQDRAVVFENHLFAVADGMGGHRAGEVAAEIAITVLGENFAPGLADPTTDALIAAVEAANARILDRADGDDELHGMGTTLTAVGMVLDGEQHLLAIVNVGDSRTYWMRGGELEQLTQDHSMVAEMVRAGQLTEDEARNHRQRSVLTRALGVEHGVKVDVLEIIPVEGQRYLLCSDGLTGEVHDDAIAATLRRIADPEEAAAELVRMAVAKGGRDNVTVVVLDVVDDDDITMLASRRIESVTTVDLPMPDGAATLPIVGDEAAAFAAAIDGAVQPRRTPTPAVAAELNQPERVEPPEVQQAPEEQEAPAAIAADPTGVLELPADDSAGDDERRATGKPPVGPPRDRASRRLDRQLRSRVVNWRVILFLAALAAVAALAIWAVRQADDVAPTTTTPTTITLSAETTVVAGGATTSIATTPTIVLPASTVPAVANGESAATTKPGATPTSANVAVTAASTVDPFVPVASTVAPTATRKGT